MVKRKQRDRKKNKVKDRIKQMNKKKNKLENKRKQNNRNKNKVKDRSKYKKKTIADKALPKLKINISWYVVGLFILILLAVGYLKTLNKFKGFFSSHPLFIFIPIGLISIYIIMKSASFAIESITSYAGNTGISEYVIGSLVVAIATSLPELSTGLFASLKGTGDLTLGNVIGANVVNLTLVLGLMAWISGKIKIKEGVISRTLPAVVMMIILPIILGLDGSFSRLDGCILLIAFVLYFLSLIKHQGEMGTLKKSVRFRHIWKDIIVFGGTIAALLLSTSLLVQALDVISNELSIPRIIVGCVILAIATTVPELTVGIKSILKGSTKVSIGNIFGSLIINFSLVLGVAAVINPIHIINKPLSIFSGVFTQESFSFLSFLVGSLILLITIFIVSRFIRSMEINKKHGQILVGIAVLFFIVQILFAVLG